MKKTLNQNVLTKKILFNGFYAKFIKDSIIKFSCVTTLNIKDLDRSITSTKNNFFGDICVYTRKHILFLNIALT